MRPLSKTFRSSKVHKAKECGMCREQIKECKSDIRLQAKLDINDYIRVDGVPSNYQDRATIIDRLKETIPSGEIYIEDYPQLISDAVYYIEELEGYNEILNALEAGGVDNWYGYDEAMETLEDFT